MKTVKTNINLYKSFLEVYETRNYSNAATNLKITQPTISYNIKELEKSLKVRLFNSNSRGVEPTKYATELYPLVKQAFVDISTAENNILEFNEESSGLVQLNTSMYFMPQLVGDIVAKFHRKYPHVKFEITPSSISEGNYAIERHESDLFIFTYYTEREYNKNDFTMVDFMKTDTTLYASKNFVKKHNLERALTKDQLESLPMISFPEGTQLHETLKSIGLAKNIIVETKSTQMFTHLAKNDVGVFWGPKGYVIDGFAEINADIQLPQIHVAIKYNNALANKAASAFIAMIRKEYNK